ncbi:Iron-sulfur cluster assembly 2, mitochondrial [Balamuthia mandrillaris]
MRRRSTGGCALRGWLGMGTSRFPLRASMTPSLAGLTPSHRIPPAAGPRWLGAAPTLYTTASAAPAEDAASRLDLTLTPRAKTRLEEIKEKLQKPFMLRVAISGGAGCHGFSYQYSIDTEPPATEDIVLQVNGSHVVVDNESAEHVRGATLDFVDEPIGRAFAITYNPNAQSSCSCGSSFLPKM